LTHAVPYLEADSSFESTGPGATSFSAQTLLIPVIPDALLPEWVPNAHPLIVHFPIALLFLAAAADALAVLLRDRWPTGREVATGLYAALGLSAVFTYYSGTWAVGTVDVDTAAAAQTLSTHSTWAWYTAVFTGVYGGVRLAALLVPRARARRAVHVAFFVVGLAAFWPLWKVGENGGEMVYRHGVGVQETQATSPPDPQPAARPSSASPSSGQTSPSAK
jgi:uncharacterized membrane protein